MTPYERIDMAYLFEISDGDKTVIKELIEIFLVQIKEFKEEMPQAIKKKDFKHVKLLAHKFKSSLRTFGLKTIAEEMEKIETNQELEQDPSLKKTIDICIRECELAYEELSLFLQKV